MVGEAREGREARADLEDGFRFSRVKNELLDDRNREREELSGVEISNGRDGHVDEKLSGWGERKERGGGDGGREGKCPRSAPNAFRSFLFELPSRSSPPAINISRKLIFSI